VECKKKEGKEQIFFPVQVCIIARQDRYDFCWVEYNISFHSLLHELLQKA
jgi:hypothetical protein